MKRSILTGRLALLLAAVLFLSAVFACAGTADPAAEHPTATLPPTQAVEATATPEPSEAAKPTEEPTPEPTAAPEPTPTVEDWIALCGREVALHGVDAPSQDTCEDGAFYVSEAQKELYFRENGEWRSCGQLSDAGYRLVTFSTNRGDAFPVQLVKTGEKAKDPGFVPEGDFAGWYADGYGTEWDFDKDEITRDTQFSGYLYDTPERREPLLTYRDIRRSTADPEGEIGVLVICVGYTDGYQPDKALLEDSFNGDYDLDNCLRSVASYYKYASYGKLSFDFRFVYYDTGLSCAEAYQKERNGGYRNEVFFAVRKANPELMRELDKNGDGYVDCVVFIGGEDTLKTVGDGDRYTIFGLNSGYTREKPDRKTPTILHFICSFYEPLADVPLTPGNTETGARVCMHEMGHVFGLVDYYDHAAYPDFYSFTRTLGYFDMQDNNVGDWNPFSRFAVGWLAPCVVPEDADEITVKIGCSSETPDCILLPTSLGWNGTPFDEYVLIDVMAPVGANGFDWTLVTDPLFTQQDEPCAGGGVRVYHVDSQMMKSVWVQTKDNGIQLRYVARLTTYEELLAVIDARGTKAFDDELTEAFLNTNGFEPYLESDSRFYHLIDLVPRDGSSKFRLSTPTGQTAFTFFSCSDLFGPGDVFSMETASDAFPDAPYMNNGGTFDYSVRIDHYDPETHEAVVTITKIR